MMRRVLAVSCDRCYAEILTDAAIARIAKETAASNGWMVTDHLDFCPDCAKRMSRLVEQMRGRIADGHAV